MADYWKSNPRKFCDFCKCWIANNKPSVEFHERGKRHQENVQTRVKEIAVKGREDYENKMKKDEYMKQMEEAALKAYRNDIDCNPDMTGTKIAKLASSKNAKILIHGKEVSPSEVKPAQSKQPMKEVRISTEKEEKKQKEKPKVKKAKSKHTFAKDVDRRKIKWYERKAADGQSYFQHIETGEKKMSTPFGGYLTISEQEKLKKGIDINKKRLPPPKPPSPPANYGPLPKAFSYAKWQPVISEPQESVDLELPEAKMPEWTEPEVQFKKPKLAFEEKNVSLKPDDDDDDGGGGGRPSGGDIVFKKRKTANALKKNTRIRNDDDDL